jgi:hypothetical protein
MAENGKTIEARLEAAVHAAEARVTELEQKDILLKKALVLAKKAQEGAPNQENSASVLLAEKEYNENSESLRKALKVLQSVVNDNNIYWNNKHDKELKDIADVEADVEAKAKKEAAELANLRLRVPALEKELNAAMQNEKLLIANHNQLIGKERATHHELVGLHIQLKAEYDELKAKYDELAGRSWFKRCFG